MNCKYLAFHFFALALLAHTLSASVKDSINVVEKNGKPTMVYEVGPKETLYSIARKYNVNPKAIIAMNPEADNGLKVGQKIFVPIMPKTAATPVATTVAAPEPPVTSSNTSAIYHTVEAKQTLYAISRRYMVSVDDIKKWNNLGGNELKVGSSIIVGYNGTSATTTASTSATAKNTATGTAPIKQVVHSGTGNDKVLEKGTVELFDTPDGQTFHYALHKTLPTGKVITVVNELSGKSVFVRVVGKLPSDGSQSIIKISKIACERLGVTDGKPFKAEISYLP